MEPGSPEGGARMLLLSSQPAYPVEKREKFLTLTREDTFHMGIYLLLF